MMPRLLATLLVAAMLSLGTQSAQASDEPWFSNVKSIDSTFYPRVPDDYKDLTKLRWNTADTEPAVCWASVYAPNGTLLIDQETVVNYQTRFDYGCDYGSGNWLEWNGRDKNGRAVPVGTYEIKVKYYSQDDYRGVQEEDVVHTLSRKVTVATGTKWFKRRLSFAGSSFDRKSTGANCAARRSGGDAVLDCWNGRHAQVLYDLYVQYDLKIKNFKWNVNGTHECCTRGTFKKWATRKRHDLKIRVKVTGWRRYDVHRVTVSWMAKDRI